MIRLRPSEITLTPADVEEARRRMLRKQSVAPSTALPSGPYPHRGPRLRRGPVRSRDDAIHHLGNVPVLTPHQVIYASTVDDNEDGQDQRAYSAGDETEAGAIDDPSVPRQSHIEQTQPSPALTLQLPFRPVLGEGIEGGQRASRDGIDVETFPSPPKHIAGVSTFGRTQTNTSEDASDVGIQSRLPGSIDGSAEASGISGPRPVTGSPAPSPQQQNIVAPFPIPQAQAVSLSGLPSLPRRTILQSPQSKPLPTLFLQGYFVSPQQYSFRERPVVPHSEPRQRSGRFAPVRRTMSSNSEPPHSISQRIVHRPGSSPAGDVFWPVSTTVPLVHGVPVGSEAQQTGGDRARSSFEERIRRVHTRLESIQGRTRDFFVRGRDLQAEHGPPELATSTRSRADQRSSETSNASLPYSYYELPISRQSSSEQSQSGEQLRQSQVDGAAPSKQVSRGAYYSIRPSQVRAVNEAMRLPPLTRMSSFSSPNLTAPLGQHGLSPRPANPYTRVHSAQNSPRPSMGLVTPDDFVGDERDAASAVVRDLSSPLDLVELRASIRLGHVPAAPSRPRSEMESVFQYQVEDFDPEPRRGRPPATGSIRQQSGNSAHHRMLPSGRHQTDIQFGEPLQHHHERSSTQGSEPPQTYQRAVAEARSAQRSSENVPVGATAMNTGRAMSRTAPEHDHRITFDYTPRVRASQGVGLRGGDIPPTHGPMRFNLHHAANPRDIPRRGRGMPAYRPSTQRPYQSREESDRLYSSSPPTPYGDYRHASQRYASGAGPNPAFPRRALTSSGSRSSDTESIRQAPARSQLEVPPHFYNYDRQLRASAPPPNRRPPIPARVASRRVSGRQLNQENSGDAEAELMREELRVASMRYAEDGTGMEVMDETPPRIGRFERRMLDG